MALKDISPSGATESNWRRTSSPSGEQLIVEYPHGYGASVVNNQYSYGGGQGLYEIAVLHGEGNKLCYATPVTNDVIGYLTEEEVIEYLNQIAALGPDLACNHDFDWELD